MHTSLSLSLSLTLTGLALTHLGCGASTEGPHPQQHASDQQAGAEHDAVRGALEQRLDAVAQRAVDEHRIVGTVMVVAHRGEIVYRKAHGYADREAQQPMAVDTVHRFASLTKPIVAVALLRLADRGAVDLDAPVTNWLPEFRPRLADKTSPPITLRQLLTHTSGLGYRFAEPADGPYHKLGVSDGMDASGITLDENLRRLAEAPLLSAPGAAWNYSLSIDVLGRVIEKVTHQDLESAIRNLVTNPVGMKDTSFIATEPSRLATPYADGKPEPVRMTASFQNPFAASTVDFSPGRALDKGAYFSGGAGMVGTADDYLRLLEVLRTGGAPLLKEPTANALFDNAIGELDTFRGPGWGFGLIGAVLVDPKLAKEHASAGSIDWGGAYGHTWSIDRAAELTIVVLTNTAFEGMIGKYPHEVREAIYGVLR
ncbi:MAG: beta-lactamase family protein [Polyangiaceae bacterium]|nr:beta-lactamase family protein [Polyangiaceae bacterium]